MKWKFADNVTVEVIRGTGVQSLMNSQRSEKINFIKVLYFSKLRIVLIFLISLFFILIASSNIFKFNNNLFNKKINLGLDLQGGSYLLLEIDNNPVIEQKLQNLTLTLRSYFKEKNIKTCQS